jgi:L-aminopeptidase/D-esterase-like protein
VSGSSLTDLPRLRVGHAETPERSTGVTCVLFDRPTPVVVRAPGGTATTYDCSSLGVDATFGRRDALFFAGGSHFGLDAARGIRTYLLSSGRGETAFGNPNPIVRIAGAVLYDLPRALGPIPDYLPLGFEAARRASPAPVTHGRVGAAAGARVGKYAGRAGARPGGLGSAVVGPPRGPRVGALVVLNSVGAVRDVGRGRWIEGARRRDGSILPPRPWRPRAAGPLAAAPGTSLVLVATDARLDRRALSRLAQQAEVGLARAVDPPHTATEGDVVFAVGLRGDPTTSGSSPVAVDRVAPLAAEAVERAAVAAFPGRSRA